MPYFPQVDMVLYGLNEKSFTSLHFLKKVIILNHPNTDNLLQLIKNTYLITHQ